MGGETQRDIVIDATWESDNADEAPTNYNATIESLPNKSLRVKERLESENPPAAEESQGRAAELLSSVRAGGSRVVRDVHGWAFYRCDPKQMRPPQPVRKEYRLSETGDNLSTVIHTLFSEGAPQFDEVAQVLQSYVPTVEKLLSPITEQGQTYAAIKEQSVPAPTGTWGMSDGTLFALALATALLTPEPPALIAIEAPDNELHPYVLENVAEALISASKRTQVIVTTHSPYLLDHFPPESIVVVEKSRGKSTVKPVRGRRGVKKVAEQLGAGSAWYAGHLGGVP